MLLNDFSGGRNSRVTPSMLQQTQAQVYTNIDNSFGPLTPIKDKSASLGSVNKYFKWYKDAQEYLSFATETSFLEYQQVMYYTQAASYPLKYDGLSTNRLGIVGPASAPVIGLDVAGVLTGTYVYTYTYYDSATGTESAPSPLTSGLAATADSILVDNLVASTDPQVDKIRIYRLGGTVTDYSLVVEKANDAATYLDNNPDSTVAGNHILDTLGELPGPTNLKYLTENYAILFGAVGNHLVYSKIGKPQAWPATYFINFEDDVTGIAPFNGGTLVFTIDKTYLVTGTSPSTFSKTLFDGEQGCVSHYSIKYIDNTLVWLSRDGLCATSGGKVDVISMQTLGVLTLEGFNNAEVHNRVYYMSHNGGILAFDLRYNTIVRDISTVVDWLDKHGDELYASISGSLYKLFAGQDLKYFYKSPILTEGSFSQLKDYKDFYIRYNGNIKLRLFIDGKLVNEKELSGNECHNLKALSSSSGYGLEIEIEGTGIVYEIEYKAGGRQNGR